MTAAALAARVKEAGYGLGSTWSRWDPRTRPTMRLRSRAGSTRAMPEPWPTSSGAGTRGPIPGWCCPARGRWSPVPWGIFRDRRRKALPGWRATPGARTTTPSWSPGCATLADTLVELAPGTTARTYVDTGPLLERDLAARAGLGWIGKNTMLLHPELGSFFFIGVVLTTAELESDAPLPDRCGSCTRCLDACPTGAFVDPYVLDARRCIAYLTIERRGSIPADLRPGIGSWTFGCDVCQDVCPWNRRAPVAREAAFGPRRHPPLADLLALGEAVYVEAFRGSPLKRARREGLARNAAIALGNGGTAADVPALRDALGHSEPTVRGHAAWALGRIGGAAACGALVDARGREADPEALEEIERALAEVSPEGTSREATG